MNPDSPADRVAQDFMEATGHAPAGVWMAPGRVNLIGEHTDYSDGFVLPFAIANGVYIAASVRNDGRYVVSSREFGRAEFDIGKPITADWLAYPESAIRALVSSGVLVPGVDIAIESTVPIGAGLSSSAALLCSILLAVTFLAGDSRSPEELALLAQTAENDWVGVPVGVMDPMASMCSIDGHVLFLDCRSLRFEHIEFAASTEIDLIVLVIDTRARHRLVGGEYAERRRSCELAAAQLGVRALRDATLGMLEATDLDEPEMRRARHVITENSRVLQTVELLRQGRSKEIGHLLGASHRSLSEDYEVSIPELDVAVSAAVDAGALGARMTGAGFGGCAIALVEGRLLEKVSGAVTDAFAARGFAVPRFLHARPSAGAHRVL